MLTNAPSAKAFARDRPLRPRLDCGHSSPLFVSVRHVPGYNTSNQSPNEGQK
jgi:hypothetical protein